MGNSNLPNAKFLRDMGTASVIAGFILWGLAAAMKST